MQQGLQATSPTEFGTSLTLNNPINRDNADSTITKFNECVVSSRYSISKKKSESIPSLHLSAGKLPLKHSTGMDQKVTLGGYIGK